MEDDIDLRTVIAEIVKDFTAEEKLQHHAAHPVMVRATCTPKDVAAMEWTGTARPFPGKPVTLRFNREMCIIEIERETLKFPHSEEWRRKRGQTLRDFISLCLHYIGQPQIGKLTLIDEGGRNKDFEMDNGRSACNDVQNAVYNYVQESKIYRLPIGKVVFVNLREECFPPQHGYASPPYCKTSFVYDESYVETGGSLKMLARQFNNWSLQDKGNVYEASFRFPTLHRKADRAFIGDMLTGTKRVQFQCHNNPKVVMEWPVDAPSCRTVRIPHIPSGPHEESGHSLKSLIETSAIIPLWALLQVSPPPAIEVHQCPNPRCQANTGWPQLRLTFPGKAFISHPASRVPSDGPEAKKVNKNNAIVKLDVKMERPKPASIDRIKMPISKRLPKGASAVIKIGQPKNEKSPVFDAITRPERINWPRVNPMIEYRKPNKKRLRVLERIEMEDDDGPNIIPMLEYRKPNKKSLPVLEQIKMEDDDGLKFRMMQTERYILNLPLIERVTVPEGNMTVEEKPYMQHITYSTEKTPASERITIPGEDATQEKPYIQHLTNSTVELPVSERITVQSGEGTTQPEVRRNRTSNT